MHITGTIKHNVNDFISFKNIKAEKEIILKAEKVIGPVEEIIEEVPDIIEENQEKNEEEKLSNKIDFNRKNRNRDKKKDGGKNE